MRAPKSRYQLLQKASTAIIVAALLAVPQPAGAKRLREDTEEAFAHYIRASELRMKQETARRTDFLWIDTLPPRIRDQANAELRDGKVVFERDFTGKSTDTFPVPGGLILDWTGMIFIPRVSMSEVIAVVQDYDQAARYYSPQVIQSQLLGHSGNDFYVFLRLKQVHLITVVLDTYYRVHYTFLNPANVTSRTNSVRIAEVENSGTAHEQDMPVGDDHGFLWRLYSYWRFHQSKRGVYVQCNSIALTRDVPPGLGWLIRPYLNTIPRDFLRFTLKSTRNAVIDQVEHQASPQSIPQRRTNP